MFYLYMCLCICLFVFKSFLPLLLLYLLFPFSFLPLCFLSFAFPPLPLLPFFISSLPFLPLYLYYVFPLTSFTIIISSLSCLFSSCHLPPFLASLTFHCFHFYLPHLFPFISSCFPYIIFFIIKKSHLFIHK